MIENLQPKGNKVIVECEDKANQEDVTASGIIVSAKKMDSGDNALLVGKVIALGTPEKDDKGHVVKPDVLNGTEVWFNRYDSFKIITKGLKTYWVVPCKQIFITGNL